MSSAKPKLKVDAIREVLLTRIRNGTYPKDSILPTENELAEEFTASRGTVSKALASLVHLGVVERKPRVGTRVVDMSGTAAASGTDLDAYAFIYPGERHPGIWRIVSAFNEAAQEAGHRTMLLSAGSDFEKETALLNNIGELKVTAAAVYPLVVGPEQRHRVESALLSCSCPVVLAENFLPGLSIPSVLTDGFDAGYALTRHLLEQGAKTVGIIGNNALGVPMWERYMGYRKALQEAGVAENPKHVLLISENLPDFENPLEPPMALARRWMQQAEVLPDAVVCTSDYQGQACLLVAREAGIKVPDDLQIAEVGGDVRDFDGSHLLTVYEHPFEEIGRETFKRLDRLASGGTIDIADYFMPLKGRIAPGQPG